MDKSLFPEATGYQLKIHMPIYELLVREVPTAEDTLYISCKIERNQTGTELEIFLLVNQLSWYQKVLYRLLGRKIADNITQL